MLSAKLQRLLLELDAHIAGSQQTIATSLQALSSTNTASHTDQIIQVLKTQFQQREIRYTQLDSAPALLFAELDRSAPLTLLLVYQYTESLGNPQTFLPLLLSLSIVDLYQETKIALPLNLKWLCIETDQNKNSAISTTLEQYVQHLQADCTLWYDAKGQNLTAPIITLGTHGKLRVSLEIQTAAGPLSSGYGNVVPNAAWRLLWALSSLKDMHEEVLIEGFYDALLPAEDEEIALLEALPDSTLLLEELGLKKALFELQGKQFHYAHLLTPSCTVTRLEANTLEQFRESCALMPHQAQAVLEFSLLPNQDPGTILILLQEHLQRLHFSDIHTRQLQASYPTHISASHPIVRCMQQAIQLAYNQPAQLWPTSTETLPLYTKPGLLPLPLLLYTSPTQNGSYHFHQELVFLLAFLEELAHVT